VTQNLLDHRAGNSESVQVGREPTPERMPAVPTEIRFSKQHSARKLIVALMWLITPRESSLSASRGFAIEDGEVNRIAWPRPKETVADRCTLFRACRTVPLSLLLTHIDLSLSLSTTLRNDLKGQSFDKNGSSFSWYR